METDYKKTLSAALKKALLEEHMWSKDAAKCLNFNPMYISMMLNPKYFDKASSAAWERLDEWHKTKDKISNFRIPDGEVIWQPTEKADKGIASEEKEVKKKQKTIKTDPAVTSHIKPDIDTRGTDIGEESKVVNIIEDITRLKVALDIEINLVVNGIRVKLA